MYTKEQKLKCFSAYMKSNDGLTVVTSRWFVDYFQNTMLPKI